MKKYSIYNPIFVLLFVVSCSSLSEKDCNELNWFQRGKTDVFGKKNWQSKLTDYKKSCDKHGVAVNEKEYLKGVVYGGEITCTGYKTFHDGRWLTVGKGDALLGRSNTYLKEHALKCNSFNITPNTKDYYKGYKVGLKQFCTYDNGITFGKGGKHYVDTCTGSLAEKFKNGYIIGKAIYDADKARLAVVNEQKKQDDLFDDVIELEEEIKELEYKLKYFDRDEAKDISYIERDIRDKEREIRFAELDKKPAAIIKDLERELGSLEDRLISSRNEFSRKERQLESTIRSKESKVRKMELDYRSSKRKIIELEKEAMRKELRAERLQSES